MSNPLNVLIASGGSFQGLTLIKGLRYSASIRIVMVDSSYENISQYFVDKFYNIPPADQKQEFLESLLDICEQEGVRLLFPSTNIELLALAENSDVFNKKGIKIAVSHPVFLKLVMNKLSLARFLLKEGFPVLPVIDITSDDLRFPILGKPLSSWGSKGIIILHSYAEIGKYQFSELKDNFIWQPFLDNYEEFSIDCAINFDGEISESVIRRRVKTIGGFAAITENIQDSTIQKMIDEFLSTISSQGAQGIFNIQVLKTGSRYYFSDVNPRIGTSAVFSYQLGINFPLFLCSYLQADISQKQRQRKNVSRQVRMVRYLEEFWIEKQSPNKIKAVVFDLDDTLINQKAWIFEKLSVLWGLYSQNLPAKSEFLSKAMQILEEGNRSHLFDALSNELTLQDTFKGELIQSYRNIVPQNCPLYPDVLSTLEILKKNGMKLALLTDNPPDSQKQKIQACNLSHLFDEIVFSRELDSEKPDKTIFLKVSHLLQIPTDNLAMVGDNLYKDIVGSLDAGYKLAFWIVRNGIFFNFNEEFIDTIFPEQYDYIKINTLKYLVWSFSENEYGRR